MSYASPVLPPVSDESLDAILALQLTIAWAGEGRCSPRRLGWWETDLVDEAGGGDLFLRLLPRTHAWASLEVVREAARRADTKDRLRLASPDSLRTLYFFGFEMDELIDDRLATLKREGRAPESALPFPAPLASFSKETLVTSLGEPTSFKIVPGGRQLKGEMPVEPERAAARLAAALVPFPDHYPLPYYQLKA